MGQLGRKQKRMNKAVESILERCEQLDIEIPSEFYDVFLVLIMGAQKYEPNNWLQENGNRSSHKDMHDSMMHHLAESFCNQRIDKDSGLDPLLHLASRAMMAYTRIKRNIKHIDD